MSGGIGIFILVGKQRTTKWKDRKVFLNFSFVIGLVWKDGGHLSCLEGREGGEGRKYNVLAMAIKKEGMKGGISNPCKTRGVVVRDIQLLILNKQVIKSPLPIAGGKVLRRKQGKMVGRKSKGGE